MYKQIYLLIMMVLMSFSVNSETYNLKQNFYTSSDVQTISNNMQHDMRVKDFDSIEEGLIYNIQNIYAIGDISIGATYNKLYTFKNVDNKIKLLSIFEVADYGMYGNSLQVTTIHDSKHIFVKYRTAIDTYKIIILELDENNDWQEVKSYNNFFGSEIEYSSKLLSTQIAFLRIAHLRKKHLSGQWNVGGGRLLLQSPGAHQLLSHLSPHLTPHLSPHLLPHLRFQAEKLYKHLSLV